MESAGRPGCSSSDNTPGSPVSGIRTHRCMPFLLTALHESVLFQEPVDLSDLPLDGHRHRDGRGSTRAQRTEANLALVDHNPRLLPGQRACGAERWPFPVVLQYSHDTQDLPRIHDAVPVSRFPSPPSRARGPSGRDAPPTIGAGRPSHRRDGPRARNTHGFGHRETGIGQTMAPRSIIRRVTGADGVPHRH